MLDAAAVHAEPGGLAGALESARREAIKENIIWNIQEGKKLTGPQLARAELKRTQLYHRVRQFMERCEFMIFPVSQVPPFSVQDRYVAEINGEKLPAPTRFERSSGGGVWQYCDVCLSI